MFATNSRPKVLVPFPGLVPVLESLELPHFMLRLSRLVLFAVQSRQSEMRLRRQGTLFFDFH